MSDVEDPLRFPMRFPVKAMGKAEDSLVELVVSLVQPLVDDFEDAEVDSKDSRNGRFRSVTVTFTARSREQLDDVYRALSGHERILYVL
jgi:putative lipoic acid-binding regulatory protein